MIMDIFSQALGEDGFNLFPQLQNSSVDEYEVVCSDGCYNCKSNKEMLNATDNSSASKDCVFPENDECDSSFDNFPNVLRKADKATQKDSEIQLLLNDSLKTVNKKSVNVAPAKESSTDTFCPHSCGHGKYSDKIKRIPCSERFDVPESTKLDNSADSKSQPCDCCYCEVFGNGVPPAAPMSKNYMEMRERLRFILSKKRTNCKATTANNVQTPPLPQSEKKGTIKGCSKPGGDTRNLDELLDFIEGNECKERNEKKAAKKARQKERKIEMIKKKEEEERAQELYKKALAEAELSKSMKQQEKMKNASSKKKVKNKQINNGDKALLEDSAPKMLTIKRIMDSNSAEPTVTITLRGATPNQDRVLYTLLNGQVCDVKESQQVKLSMTSNGSHPHKEKNNVVPAKKYQGSTVSPSSNASSRKKRKKKNNVKSTDVDVDVDVDVDLDEVPNVQNINPLSDHNGLTNPTAIQINNAVNRMSKNENSFKIEDLKLPPGITITKVDPNAVNSKIPLKEKSPFPKGLTPQFNRPPPSSEVIVVSTGHLRDRVHPSKDEFGGEIDQENSVTSSKKKKNKKNKTDQSSSAGPVNSHQKKTVQLNGLHSDPRRERNSKGPTVINNYNCNNLVKTDFSEKSIVNPTVEHKKKKKKKKSKSSSLYDINSEELSLLDSVFAPKDIDLENGDIDDAERELEAFKRFCFQSVPPKRKEKVHLNIKDIILRKKTNYSV